ncbi:hypothetical protein NC661_17075 [Aquibacillus koreensis]|uniref:DUF2157 domain-containing protein n=1 Tax=Aquibacillus koreensis TaxID=279446 RepID=A0A9X3WRM2_9BACI|nr:hypothetical protein [Aquibacillus koreensis]MCT2536149.1 hypothetical protein [Aquibacillus koreensis]MDC3422074.1 hypothetical protein [Aquibacillus koreensis]
MDHITERERQKVFQQELVQLRNEGFISQEMYQKLMSSYDDYLKFKFNPNKDVATVTENEEQEKKPILQTNVKKAEPKPFVQKKTPEQVRERNITWSLILGVLFILVGGLVLATSTWDQMGPILKVISLSFVSVFFIGLSTVTSRFLKIDKTAFAFLTLGSMLIPITIIAIGYFELLGEYLSLTGDGRFVLGLIGTLVPLPLYFRYASKHKSRLFVWISYLFLSLSAGFAIAATHVSVDFFYLGIMLFNALLLYGYHRLKNKEGLGIFLKELPSYAQLNLVVSTLLMLFIYEQEVFYSFNLFITASLYMAMVFLYKTKEYQFVFLALFAYGVYQLTEHSFLQSVDVVMYAMIGLAYLAFSFFANNDGWMSKVFRYTSGVISVFAFIYVSYQGLIIRAGEDSWILLLAYLIIAFNYIYLAFLTNQMIFRYLAPVFLFATGLQLWNSFYKWLQVDEPGLFMFGYSTLLFLTLGIWNRNKYLLPIRKSTYYTSIGVMLLCMLYELLMESPIQLAIMLFSFGALAIIVVLHSKKLENKLAGWIYAISWGLALLVLFPEITDQYPLYQTMFDWPFHLSFSGLVILAISYLWKKINKRELENTSFYIAQGLYFIGLLQLVSIYQTNETYVRPIILLIGIALAVQLVQRVKAHVLWLLVAMVAYSFYASLLSTLAIDSFQGIIFFLQFGIVIFFAVEKWVGVKITGLKPYFFWFSHGVQFLLIMAIVLDQMFSKTVTPIILFVPLVIYLYSTQWHKKEWHVRLHLYAAMTMVALVFATVLPYYDLFQAVAPVYYWLGASLIYLVTWFGVKGEWRKRMEYFIVPFSLYGLVAIVSSRIFEHYVEIIPLVGYVILNLFFLHKRHWTLLNMIPLLLSIAMWEQLQPTFSTSKSLWFISVACFFVLMVAGQLLHKELYNWKAQPIHIDWYAVIAFIYAVYALNFIDQEAAIWMEVIPFLLITLGLFVQLRRMMKPIARRVTQTLIGVSLLPSYYIVFDAYYDRIPDLIQAELMMLPLLALTVVLTVTTWKTHKKMMHMIQLIVLVLITAYLVMDAIQSNTIWDAVIIGFLSLFSMIVGMQAKIKSYFFVGVGTLLFNVLYQTKPYWGNMPWWGYLLIAGFTLITVASYNEWQKQSKKEDKLKQWMKKLVNNLKKWQ